MRNLRISYRFAGWLAYGSKPIKNCNKSKDFDRSKTYEKPEDFLSFNRLAGLGPQIAQMCTFGPNSLILVQIGAFGI